MEGGYSFSSQPRAVKSKYRPDDNQGATKNIHSDPRVARGSTYAMPVAPQEAPPLKPKRKRLKETIFEVKAETQKYIPVPLEQYLVEQETPVEVRDESEQTDVFRPKPVEREYYTRNLPKKRGVDVSTQIEPEDNLFDFDWEVEPLLNVLIGKTLELGLMEVEEEAELEAIRKDKADFMAKRAQERDAEFAAEAAELKRVKEKDARVQREQERVRAEAEVAAKVFALQSVKLITGQSKTAAFKEMEKKGLFYDPDWKMVQDNFMPWLYKTVDSGFEEVKQAQAVVDGEFLLDVRFCSRLIYPLVPCRHDSSVAD